jgi:hypothetical protein
MSEQEQPSEGISDTQRNGSITGIGIVLGFSLAFIAQWSFLPGSWQIPQFVALLVAIAGVFLQLFALIKVLFLRPLSLLLHNKMVKTFVWGVCFVLLGFGAHVFFDFLAR